MTRLLITAKTFQLALDGSAGLLKEARASIDALTAKLAQSKVNSEAQNGDRCNFCHRPTAQCGALIDGETPGILICDRCTVGAMEKVQELALKILTNAREAASMAHPQAPLPEAPGG